MCVLYPGLDGNHLMQMAEAINCCYARTAVHTIVQKLYEEKGGVKQLTAQHMPQLIKDYNALFDAMSAMQLTTQKHSTIKKLMVLFYSHWDVHNQSFYTYFHLMNGARYHWINRNDTRLEKTQSTLYVFVVVYTWLHMK